MDARRGEAGTEVQLAPSAPSKTERGRQMEQRGYPPSIQCASVRRKSSSQQNAQAGRAKKKGEQEGVTGRAEGEKTAV